MVSHFYLRMELDMKNDEIEKLHDLANSCKKQFELEK
jgi:hypothetical protein